MPAAHEEFGDAGMSSGESAPDSGSAPPIDDGGLSSSETDFDIRDLQAYVVPRNSTVGIRGVVVTGVRHGSGATELFVQEPEGTAAFSGLHVFLYDALTDVAGVPRVGDLVELRGRIVELQNPAYFASHTAMFDTEELAIVGAAALPSPTVINEADLLSPGTENPWHSVLVQIESARVASINERDEVVLESGVVVDDLLFEFERPSPGTRFGAIIGPVDQDFDSNRIVPRGPGDLRPANQ